MSTRRDWRQGDRLVRKKYGTSYFAEIGRRGAQARKKRAGSPPPTADV